MNLLIAHALFCHYQEPSSTVLAASASASMPNTAAAHAKGDELQSFYTDGTGVGPGLLRRFSAELLPLVLALHGSTAHPGARAACLGALIRIVHYSAPINLEEDLRNLSVCSLAQALLLARDAGAQVRSRLRCASCACCEEVCPLLAVCLSSALTFPFFFTPQAAGLHLAEILLSKLPSVYTPLFVREGVVHSVGSLAEGGAAAQAAPGGSVGAAQAAVGSDASRGAAHPVYTYICT